MFSRKTAIAWIGIILLSGMFLMGQDSWGPQEKIVFVTDGLYNGTLGGLSGADDICQAEADDAGLAGQYKAWLSDSSSGPDSQFTRHDGTYALVDGTVVADGWIDLTDGSLDHPINLTPTFATYLGGVWTNTYYDGAPVNTSGNPVLDCCNDWAGTSGYTGVVGWAESMAEYWSVDPWVFSRRCYALLPLYCVQQ